jgi:hypothetical protein
MKRLTLVKTSNNHNIAHLYEHIFCNQLEKLFIKNRLINYLDYHYDARTYYGGFIHIQILLFTPAAERVIGQLEQCNPSFDEHTTRMAELEIMAEKQARAVGDLKKIVKSLQALHVTPWQHIDEVGVINTQDIRHASRVLRFYDAPRSDFRLLSCTASLAREPDLTLEVARPLFRITTDTILNNLTLMLTRDYAYFGYDKSWGYTSSSPRNVRKYRVYKQQVVQLVTITESYEDLIQTILKDRLVEKILAYIGDASYEQPFGAPDELELYENSGLLVGGAGWREIATPENIMKILHSVDLTLSYAKEHRIMAAT